MSRFDQKTVIVTGAGQGIGYEICRQFAQEGATVALNDISADLARQAAIALNNEIGAARVQPYPCDVADLDAVTDMVAQIDKPDVLIANAGITHYVSFLECTPQTFDRVLNVNLRGTYFLAQAVAKKMIAAEKPGRIIIMSSVVGLRAFQNFSIYGLTKAALQMLAKSLALELGEYGITVNAISPGATLTERTAKDDPDYAENWATVNITGRVGTVADIASAALFLASDEASQITGHNLVVDGGWVIRSPLPEAHPDIPDAQDDLG